MAEETKVASTGLEVKQESAKKDENVYYTGKLGEVYRFYIDRAERARILRERKWHEFDNLTYEKDYLLNEDARNSYLRPKRNDDEVRVNTGTTEKKIEAVQNELLAMNLQAEIMAYDDDDSEIVDLGRDMGDVVKRTNEIERDDDFWVEAIQELLCQRAVFVEELFIDKQITDKRISKGKIGEEDFEFITKPKRFTRCEKRVISGLQVYLGDPSLPAYRFRQQPYIVKYDRMMYEQAKGIFGTWGEWNKVKAGGGSQQWFQGAFKYRFNKLLEDNEVEVIHYMSYPDDEQQYIVNGVMMLEPNTPLHWEREGYNIEMVTLKPLGRTCAYGKPLTASAKTLQALDNETIRLLIRKFRQALEPPLGVTSGRIYSKDIWEAGAVTQGLKKDTFSKLIDHTGVTQSEMSMYQLITDKTEEFIGASDVLQGIKSSTKTSATEIMNQQRQAIKQLGFAVLAVMRLKRDLTYQRIYNILENYTRPYDKKPVEYFDGDALNTKVVDIYRKFTAQDATFENGKKGKKVVQFMDRDLTPEEEEQIYEYSEEQEKIGNPIRIKTINVKKLREITTHWYVTVNPTEKDGSALQQAMFQDKLVQAAGISKLTGRPLNGDKVIEDFERTWKTKDLFQKQAPQMGLGMGGGEGAGDQQAQEMEKMLSSLESMGSPVGNDVAAGAKAPARPARPSVNSMVNAQ